MLKDKVCVITGASRGIGEAIARRILADMRGERFTPTEGYSYSRYKNTSEISWRKEMDKALEKARAAQQPSYEQLSFNETDLS